MEMYGKDRKRRAEKRVRRHLTSKILILIIVFILPLNLIFFLTVQRSIGKVEQQIRLSLQNAADVYMDALDKDMERVDYYLYSSYISNTDFVTLLNTKDELQYQNAKYRCIRDMQDEICTVFWKPGIYAGRADRGCQRGSCEGGDGCRV